MENFINALKIILSCSVCYVWFFRYSNVVKDFDEFKLESKTRNFVGASKIILSILIILSIWYSSLSTIPTVLMGLFMLAAQFFHFKIKNPFIKRLPSLILLVICLLIITGSNF